MICIPTGGSIAHTCELNNPTPPKVVKTPSCGPVLEGSALEIRGLYLTGHSCKVNVSTFISDIVILF